MRYWNSERLRSWLPEFAERASHEFDGEAFVKHFVEVQRQHRNETVEQQRDRAAFRTLTLGRVNAPPPVIPQQAGPLPEYSISRTETNQQSHVQEAILKDILLHLKRVEITGMVLVALAFAIGVTVAAN